MELAERIISAIADIWAKEHGCTAETTIEGLTAKIKLTYEEENNVDAI